MKRHIAFKVSREAVGLTQTQAGKLAKVSAASISSYEAGKEISDVYVDAIEKALQAYKDKIYPLHSVERSELQIHIYERLWEAAETTNDKKRFLIKLMMSIAYVQEATLNNEIREPKRW